MGDAFHQTAITEERVGAVINQIVTGAVELRAENFLSQRHSHRITNTLTQRASGSFNAWRITVFRVARCFGVQLTEVFNLFNRQIIACQVQSE